MKVMIFIWRRLAVFAKVKRGEVSQSSIVARGAGHAREISS